MDGSVAVESGSSLPADDGGAGDGGADDGGADDGGAGDGGARYFLLKSCDEHEFIVDVFAIGAACAAFAPLMNSAREASAIVDGAPGDFEWREARMRRIRLKEQCFTQHVVERLLRFILIDRQDVEACDLNFQAESNLDPDFALRCLAAADFLQCATFMEATIKKLVGPWLVRVEQAYGKLGIRRAISKRIPRHLYVQVLSGVVSDVCFELYSKDLLLFEAGDVANIAHGSGSKRRATKPTKAKTKTCGSAYRTLLSKAEWEAVWASHYRKCALSLAGSIEYGPPQTSIMSMLPHQLAVLYDDAQRLETKRPGRFEPLMTQYNNSIGDGDEADIVEEISEAAANQLPGFQICYLQLKTLIRYLQKPRRYQLSNLPAAKILVTPAAQIQTSEKSSSSRSQPPRAPSRSPPHIPPSLSSSPSTEAAAPAVRTNQTKHIPGTRGRRNINLNRCGGGFALPPPPQGLLDARRRVRQAALASRRTRKINNSHANKIVTRKKRPGNVRSKKSPVSKNNENGTSGDLDVLPPLPFETVHPQAMEVFAPRRDWTRAVVLRTLICTPPEKSSTHLRRLCLRGIASLDDESIKNIAQCFPNIVDLDLSVGGVGRVGCENGVKVYLGEQTRMGTYEEAELDELELHGGGGGTDAALMSLASLAALERLQLCNWSKITESGLVSFFNALPRTRLLAPRPRSNDLRCGPEHRYSSRLPSLSPMRDIRADVKIMAPELCELNLSACRRAVTDKAMAVFARRMQGVTVLQLYGCYKLTNNAVFSLSDPDLRLKRLNVSGCYKVDDKSIHHCLLTTHHDLLLYQSPNRFVEATAKEQG